MTSGVSLFAPPQRWEFERPVIDGPSTQRWGKTEHFLMPLVNAQWERSHYARNNFVVRVRERNRWNTGLGGARL